MWDDLGMYWGYISIGENSPEPSSLVDSFIYEKCLVNDAIRTIADRIFFLYYDLEPVITGIGGDLYVQS